MIIKPFELPLNLGYKIDKRKANGNNPSSITQIVNKDNLYKLGNNNNKNHSKTNSNQQ